MKALLIAVIIVGAATAATAASFDVFDSVGIDGKPNAVIPLDGRFHDDRGQVVTLRAIAGGKPMLLVPVVHRCPNICGVTLDGLATAIKAQPYRPGADFEVIAVGIDPAEGTEAAAESMAKLQARFPDLRGVRALTGGKADVEAVTAALGYRYAWDDAMGQYAHAAAVAVLTADGHLARWLYGLAPEPSDIRLALTEAGDGTTASITEHLLLLCYHYDPAAGRYAPLVWRLLRGAAVLTIGGFGGFIFVALRRERRIRRASA